VLLDTDNTLSEESSNIHNVTSMAAAIAQIGDAQEALSSPNDTNAHGTYSLYTTMNGFVSLAPGIHQGGGVNIAANSLVTFYAPIPISGEATNHVWVINLSEALTVGAGTVFETDVPEGHTATIIWNVGAAVTLGAGTKFIGTAFVGGSFNAATSDVSCGNIYATGAVSVGSIGALEEDEEGRYTPVVCDTNARSAGPLVTDVGAYTITITAAEDGAKKLPYQKILDPPGVQGISERERRGGSVPDTGEATKQVKWRSVDTDGAISHVDLGEGGPRDTVI
jgi:hypothetical protein